MKLSNQVTVGWFEIPVRDMSRAMHFYEAVFNCKLSRNRMGPLDMAWFPWEDQGKGAGGSLVQNEEFYVPSANGALVYFSSGNLAVELSRVEKAGGKIIVPKKLIAPDVGYMGLFTDTEGNRIALHSSI